jgi:cytidyltransferase-like protein
MKIGILGGTFNPIHIGHLILAEQVQERLGLDKIIFVPANLPPHKENADIAPAPDRLKMVSLAIKGNKNFGVSDIEINPLVVLPNGGLLAVDAVLEVDNSALSRIKHPLPDRVGRIENPLERRGREIGVTYVDLSGDIGLISSGAGLGMASTDIIGEKMKPAIFLRRAEGLPPTCSTNAWISS